MKKISIVVPVHNTAPYLKSCLNSILSQSEKSIEVIIVNDHSTDNGLEIIKFFEKMYPQIIRVIDMKESYGVSCARNEGMRIAEGECIGFVDSDDIVSKNMFGDFYKYIKEYQVPIVMGHNKRISKNEFLNEETFETNRKDPKYLDVTKEENVQNFVCSCWDKLFLHDFVENEIFLENRIYQDVSFIFPILLKAGKIVEVKEKDYLYRKNTEGITCSGSKINPKVFDIYYVALDAIKRGKRYNLSKMQMKCLENYIKKAILCRIQYIINWEIKEQEKKFLIEKALSVLNYYFPNIKNVETTSKDVAENAIINLRNYGYEEYEKEELAIKNIKRVERLSRSLERRAIHK